MKFITVDVTQEDIDLGQAHDATFDRAESCPIARAVRRQLPNAIVSWSRWLPDEKSAASSSFPLSKKAAAFVHKADSLRNGTAGLPRPILKPTRLRLRIA